MQDSGKFSLRFNKGKRVYRIIASVIWEHIGIKKWKISKVVLHSILKNDKHIEVDKVNKETRIAIKKKIRQSVTRS